MADRIITAEALITAKDATGDVFARIGQKIQGFSKSATVSKDIDRMTQSLERAQSQLRALEKFQSSRTGFSDARTRFNAQKQALEQFARTMRETEAPTKKMEADYKRLQAEVSRSAASFEKSKAAMLDAKHAAESFGSPLAKVASEQGRLRGVIDQTTKSIEHQAQAERKAAAAHLEAEKAAERRAHGIAHHGVGNLVLSAAAGYASAHGVMTGIERTMHVGAEYQSELVALRNAGRTPDEIAEMQRASKATVLAAPTADYLENLKVLNETTGAFGSVEHAIEHLTFMQKAASVLHATAGDKISDGPGELGNKLARFFEMRGTAGNSEVFEHEASEMMKAMVFSRGNFNPAEMINFAQQAKSALQNYDLEFLSKVAPSLVTEVGGDRAGTQANAFNSVLLGKANDKRQAEAWLKYGLIDPKQMVMKGGTPVAWTGGAVYHTDEFLKNPLAAGEKYLLPALAAKGVNIEDRLELTKVLGTLFRNQNSNAFANELWQAQNRQRLHKDKHLIGEVDDPDNIYQRNLHSDPKVALGALTASLHDLMITASSPLMGQAASGLAVVAGGVQHLANFLKDSPVLATGAGLTTGAVALGGAGYLSYQFMNGFGLGTSAAALDGSAVALDASAGALTAAAGKDVAGGLVQAVEGGLARNSAAVAGAAEGAFAKEAGAAFKSLSLSSVVMTVGTLSIAGIAAAIVIDAMAHGKPKDLAANHPDFGNPFAASTTAKLPLDVAPPSQGVIVPGSPQDQRPPSNAIGPGHWTYGRGGFRQWIPDKGSSVGNPPPPLRNPPFFTNGAFDASGALRPEVAGVLGVIGQLQGKGKDQRGVVVPWGSVAPGGPKWAQMPNFGPLPAFVDPNREQYGPYMPGNAKLGHEMLGPVMPHPQVVQPVGAPLDIRPPAQREAMAAMPPTAFPVGAPQTIDVTGKVQAEVQSHVTADSTVKVEITAAPGIEARQTFKSTATKVSTGPSVPNAGAAPAPTWHGPH